MVLKCILMFVTYLRHGCKFALSHILSQSFSSVLCDCGLFFSFSSFVLIQTCVRRCTGSIIAERAWIIVIYLSCKYCKKKRRRRKSSARHQGLLGPKSAKLLKKKGPSRCLVSELLIKSTRHVGRQKCCIRSNFTFVWFKKKKKQRWTPLCHGQTPPSRGSVEQQLPGERANWWKKTDLDFNFKNQLSNDINFHFLQITCSFFRCFNNLLIKHTVRLEVR